MIWIFIAIIYFVIGAMIWRHCAFWRRVMAPSGQTTDPDNGLMTGISAFSWLPMMPFFLTIVVVFWILKLCGK